MGRRIRLRARSCFIKPLKYNNLFKISVLNFSFWFYIVNLSPSQIKFGFQILIPNLNRIRKTPNQISSSVWPDSICGFVVLIQITLTPINDGEN